MGSITFQMAVVSEFAVSTVIPVLTQLNQTKCLQKSKSNFWSSKKVQVLGSPSCVKHLVKKHAQFLTAVTQYQSCLSILELKHLNLTLGINVLFLKINGNYKDYQVLSAGGNKTVTEAASASSSADYPVIIQTCL